MSRNVWTMVKKELTRFLTDRRMLFSLLLPGLMIFVLYSVMGDMTSKVSSIEDDYQYQVYIENQPDELNTFNQSELYDIVLINDVLTKDEIINRIEEKEIDLYIVYEDDFYQKVLNYEVGEQLAPLVEIYYNSTKNESREIYNYYTQALTQFESGLANRFDINRSQETIYDQASENDVSIQVITSLVPFLLVTFLFSGAMSVASESIAGEKERGTIATLLITPTKRSEIALGKIISLSMITLVSATSSFIGLMLSIPKLLNGVNISLNMYGVGTYILLFVVLISTVLIYVVLLSIVSAYAKTIKEAGALAVPLLLINMLVGISSMLGVSSSGSSAYFIPIFNSVQSITSILSLEVNSLNLGITIATNLVVVSLGVWLLTRMFNSEKVMFNKA